MKKNRLPGFVAYPFDSGSRHLIRSFDCPLRLTPRSQSTHPLRYLAIDPKRTETIEKVEFVKGTVATAPVVVAVTVEGR